MKNQMQMFRLFNPLFPHINRRNEWGDIGNDRKDLTVGD